MAQFTYISASDAGAPPLNGTTGSLIAVFDYCLTGSAGWKRVFSASNAGGTVIRATYRPPSGSRFYLCVQDDALGVALGKEARVGAFEVCTAQDTGSYSFPSASAYQTSGSTLILSVRKSTSSDLVTRAYKAFVDPYTFYFNPYSGDTLGQGIIFGFGDFYSYGGTNDSYRSMIFANYGDNTTNPSILNNAIGSWGAGYVVTGTPGRYICRNYAGSYIPNANLNVTIVSTLQGLAFPNPYDQSFYYSPYWLTEFVDGNSQASVRGHLRGFYQALTNTNNLTDADTISGSNGKAFMIIKGVGISFAFELSNTLDTN